MKVLMILLGILTGSILGIVTIFLLEVGYSYFPRKIKKYKNIIVLGAKLDKNDKVTRVLAARLDLGKQLLSTDGKIIVTGSNIHSKNISEAVAMKEYLIMQGIAKSQIIVEPLANNTHENLIEAKKLLTSKDVAIATSKYHVARVKIETLKVGLPAKVFGARGHSNLKEALRKELLAILWKNRMFFYTLLIILSMIVITIVMM